MTEHEKPGAGRHRASKEEPAAEETSGSVELARRVVELEKQLAAKEDQVLRLAADFENFRRRQLRNAASAAEDARIALFEALLPVLDNFQRALAHAPETESGKFIEGVKMIQAQLAEVLRQAGLETFESVGEPFDPNLHHALMTTTTTDVPEGHVVEEVLPGYKMNDRIVRAAQVITAVRPEEE